MSSVQLTGGVNSNYGFGRPEPPKDLNKDDLTKLQQKLKSEGKDTSNLDKIISNFDKLDTDKDGKVSIDELKKGAEQYNIKLPSGHRHHHHKPTEQTDNNSNTVSSNNNFTPGIPFGLIKNASDDATTDTSQPGINTDNTL